MNKQANKQLPKSATQSTGRRYDGKTVLITGGGKGIGLAATVKFARGGARVIVFDHKIENTNNGADAARKAGAPDAYSAALDIGDEATVVSALMEVAEQFGTPSVIVNNAGAMDFKPIAELTVEDWKLTRLNCMKGPDALTR